ncbi:MAG: dCMP deaminase family protein [Acholeplasmatales bacterium]|jgi:dCMP deaminase|nr:dCMP deaminase family protein [Acholeplasmatales bacterium]
MKGNINWDEYFMGVAELSSLRSKDPNTKVGACIVNSKNHIIGIGYNGMPYGCKDSEFPWDNQGEFLDTKYPYVVHAEANAILNSTSSLDGATIYVTLFPCNECCKLIIQSGIKNIIYKDNKYSGSKENIAGQKMLAAAGVNTIYKDILSIKEILS